MNGKKRKTLLGNIIPTRSDFKIFKSIRFKWVINHLLFPPSIISLGLAIGLSLIWISASFAQGRPVFIRLVRTMESEKTELQYPDWSGFLVESERLLRYRWIGIRGIPVSRYRHH